MNKKILIAGNVHGTAIGPVGVISPEHRAMLVSLRVKIFGMYISQHLVYRRIDDTMAITILISDEIRHWSDDFDAKLALHRLRDITAEHEDIFVDFAQALQGTAIIQSNEDIETAVIAFSMAANRLRDLGYDCDGLIDAGFAVDLKNVTVQE